MYSLNFKFENLNKIYDLKSLISIHKIKSNKIDLVQKNDLIDNSIKGKFSKTFIKDPNITYQNLSVSYFVNKDLMKCVIKEMNDEIKNQITNLEYIDFFNKLKIEVISFLK